MALLQNAWTTQDPRTKQVLKDEEGNPKMVGDSYGEKKAVRLQERTDATKWVFEVPQAVWDSEIIDFSKTLDAGWVKNKQLAL